MTPVLFLIFNRPDTTQQVFNEIKKAKPNQIFVAADGPREDNKDDIIKCEEARKIIKQVDWDCNVKTLFRTKNVGCKYAVSGAIDWFFDNVEEGIILEDDCLPSQSFFWFCQELLEKYKDNGKIKIINGNNFGYKSKDNKSYYFCNYPQVWGWATWKRTWKDYDVNIREWTIHTGFKLGQELGWNYFEIKLQNFKWELVKTNNIDTWDYQLHFMIFKLKGTVIAPKENLISNIGYGLNATHTKRKNQKMSIKEKEINFPLKHPSIKNINKEINYFYKINIIGKYPIINYFIMRIRHAIKT
ncbi:MAG: nucleotide-diphospho-sugar transferase [Candidatus Cloacimonetes bacterium]|nr:nucleotide-diphospho-sugar transferase [Candidatus Cloacimonadota bacterium]